MRSSRRLFAALTPYTSHFVQKPSVIGLKYLLASVVANLCYASNDPSVGLLLNRENSAVKCYMADTGLLVSMVLSDENYTGEDVYKAVLMGQVGLNEGMLIENVMAQTLVANGKKLFFYSQSGTDLEEPEKKRLEIDFLIRHPYPHAANKPRISPIEVKSDRQYGTKSLDLLKEEYPKRIGLQFVVSPRPLRLEGERLFVPLYMAHLIK